MKWSGLVLVLCLSAAFGLSACGSDDDSSSSSSAKTETTASDTVPAPPTTPPADIQVSTPLTKAAQAGKKVIWLQCELPSCARFTPAIKSATAALGWSFKSQVFKNNGEGPAGAMDQAIAQKPDYIAITGIPQAALKAQLKKAASENIKVSSGSTPEPASPGGWMSQAGGTLQPDAENVSKWMINDSGGKANIVAVTIPQFPVLNTQTDWMKKEIPTLCSGCTYDQLDVTVDEVGAGSVPQKLVGYLQAHPNVNYAYFTFSDLGKGVGKVLKGAGQDKVKLTGCCGDAANAKEIVAGTTNAWTISPNEYTGWAMVDAMARDSVGMDLTETNEQIYESPSWVVDSPESVDKYLKQTDYDWPGPAGFEDQFKTLWQAG